jgi:hypothetical protein
MRKIAAIERSASVVAQAITSEVRDGVIISLGRTRSSSALAVRGSLPIFLSEIRDSGQPLLLRSHRFERQRCSGFAGGHLTSFSAIGGPNHIAASCALCDLHLN